MATGVEVTRVVDKSGLGRTIKEVRVFSLEIVGSFVDSDRFFYESWKVLGRYGENLNSIKINDARRVRLTVVTSVVSIAPAM